MTRTRAFSWRHWPFLALVASLLLNAFLVGMLATETLRHKRHGDGPRVISWELRRLAGRLPDEALERIKADLAPVAEGFDARFQALRAQREEISRIVAEPNPDRHVIDARLAEMRAASAQLQEDVQRATYDSLLRLPPEMRARLAERHEER